MDSLKSVVDRSARNLLRVHNSSWLQGRDISICNIEPVLLEVASRSALGWHHITPGLIQLACLLLDTGGSVSAASSLPSGLQQHQPATVGSRMLVRLYEKHLAIRPEILEQVLTRSVSRSRGSAGSLYTNLLRELVQRCPQSAVGLAPRIKDILSYLSYLSQDNGSRFLAALLPLIKISPSIRDTTVLVLRKALFSKEISCRKMAVSGYIGLLSTFHDDQAAGDAAELCHELLGSLRRCLSQQTEVRRHLYRSLFAVCVTHPGLSVPALRLLEVPFRRVVSARADALPPIRIQCATKISGGVVTPDEPIHELVIFMRCVCCNSDCRDSHSSARRAGTVFNAIIPMYLTLSIFLQVPPLMLLCMFDRCACVCDCMQGKKNLPGL